MTNRWKLIAGVLDAGMSSLATLAMGVYAVRFFDPAMLGGYALVFSAFLLVSLVPRELVFVPAEVAAVLAPRSARIGLLPNTFRVGLLPSLVAGLLTPVWILGAPPEIPPSAVLSLTLTGIACAFLSPIQDHVRRMFHIGAESWKAVGVSVVQLLGMATALGVMMYLEVPTEWVPFGALALANLLSLIAAGGFYQFHSGIDPGGNKLPAMMELLRTGWLLLLGAVLAPAAAFLSAVIVARLAGAAALGYAEAARVIARPLPVLANGLAAVVRPESIEAAQTNDPTIARNASRLYLKLFSWAGLLYIALVGFETSWNPLTSMLPNAYVVAGLVAVTVVGEILSVIQLPYRYELVGGGRGLELSQVEGVGAAARLGTAATAGVS